MSTPYQTSYLIRYNLASVYQQTETAIITAAGDIINEDPATAGHADRVAWAQWANQNSSIAVVSFMWAIAMNATIIASVVADPTGGGVKDTDIQFVVNSALPNVIAAFVANPPPGAKLPV